MKYNKFKISRITKYGLSIVLFYLFTGHTVRSSKMVVSDDYIFTNDVSTYDPILELKKNHYTIKISLEELVNNQLRLNELNDLKKKLEYERNSNTVSRTPQ